MHAFSGRRKANWLFFVITFINRLVRFPVVRIHFHGDIRGYFPFLKFLVLFRRCFSFCSDKCITRACFSKRRKSGISERAQEPSVLDMSHCVWKCFVDGRNHEKAVET